MIPARYAASRFPGKLMEDLGGKPIIVRTYEAAVNTGLFEAVYVVTDSDIIFETIEKYNGKVIRSIAEHECGSDRIAEAVATMNVDIIVNVQGDEPFIDTQTLTDVLAVFNEDTTQEIDLASPMTIIKDTTVINNPNVVKVIVDHRNFALYFSRAPIPYPRAKITSTTYYKHIGIYAFRKRALIDFQRLPMLALEATEKIEAIRYLEYGKKIKMVPTAVTGVGIDTPEDLKEARKLWK